MKQDFTYVWFDADKNPCSYATFRLANEADGRNLVCSRVWFVDQRGFWGMMGLIKSLAADHTYLKFETPVMEVEKFEIMDMITTSEDACTEDWGTEEDEL